MFPMTGHVESVTLLQRINTYHYRKKNYEDSRIKMRLYSEKEGEMKITEEIAGKLQPS